MLPLHLIQERIEAACARAGRNSQDVTLIGASKTRTIEQLTPLVAAGLSDLGENYVQEGVAKILAFEANNVQVTWHLIGALQSNKAREAVAHFEIIHSLDRISLAKELNKEARKVGKVQRVLVQVNIGDEDSKAGVSPENLPSLLESCQQFENLKVEGLMSLPLYSENPEETRPFHRRLRELRDELRTSERPLDILSMGMSRDFEIAVEEGATMVRIGTALWGTRS